MIGGIVAHTGGAQLADHLAVAKGHDAVAVQCVGLASETIHDAVRELGLMAIGARTGRPLLHALASPSIPYSPAAWLRYWTRFETEFGLEAQPYLEVSHTKLGSGGRTAEHRHRVYLRVRHNRRTITLSHGYARQEKLSRIAESENGERLVAGRHNLAVVSALEKEGRHDVADAMRKSGLLDVRRPIALSGSERAATERAQDIASDEVWRRAYDAWRRSTSPASLVAELSEAGLHVAQGRKGVVVITANGTAHGLRRALCNGSHRADGTRIRAKDLAERLVDVRLSEEKVVRAALTPRDAGVFGIAGMTRPGASTSSSRTGSHAVSSPASECGSLRATLQDRRNFGRTPSVQDVQPERGNLRESAADTVRRHDVPGIRLGRSGLLTPAQEKAAAEFIEAISGGSSREAERLSRKAQETSKTAIFQQRSAKSRNTEDCAALERDIKLRVLGAGHPAVGLPNWRARYRSDLAGIPREFGPMLAWVERIDGRSERLRLASGAIIHVSPERAVATVASSDTVEIMIAVATKYGWKTVEITGGSHHWRATVARAALSAGIEITGVRIGADWRDDPGTEPPALLL